MRYQGTRTSKTHMVVQRRRWGIPSATEGAQLLEFALAMPLLVVLLVGISDFATAYNLKQKLTNAAREGARIAAIQSRADLTRANPSSVQAVRNAVAAYLANAGVTRCSINTTATAAGNFTWTYSSSGAGCTASPILTIERNFPVTVNGTTTLSTRVTLNYPFNWLFSRVIGLLVPSASFPGATWMSTRAIMENLT